MTSPAPWADARARILAAISPDQPAPLGGLPCQWPNEIFDRPEQVPWLSVDSYGVGMRAVEMSRFGAWQEDGEIVVTVMVPDGTGVGDAKAISKAISDIFRHAQAEDAPVVYGRQIIDFGQKSADGLWWETPVLIGLRYIDRPD